jgi:hypothetical protein
MAECVRIEQTPSTHALAAARNDVDGLLSQTWYSATSGLSSQESVRLDELPSTCSPVGAPSFVIR